MWNSFRTDARTGITAEVITYPGGGGDEIHAWVARPTAEQAGDQPVPGIVAVHHLPGWDEFYREFSERLARHGYSVICPDLFCRFGHGTPDDVAARVRSQGLFGHDDQHPSPAQVDLHEAELKRNGKAYEFYRYDGAGHGFFYYHTPMYRPEQAMDGWEKVFGFFSRDLSG